MPNRRPARTRSIAAWSVWLFVGCFALELGLGIYVSHFRSFVYYDAVSRVANAFYVLYSRDPHLGAIGFVWNPLPSLLELVPLLLWPILPAVAASGLAANIVTALFAAGAATLLFRYSWSSTQSLFLSLFLVVAYACNPFIFLYGANGMSEAMFGFFVLWMTILLLRWMKDDETLHPLAMGFALALAFWIRYEAIAFGVGLAAAVLGVMIQRIRSTSGGPATAIAPQGYPTAESTLIVILTPAVFSGFTWLGLNWAIMGDPLYFFRSGYSNLAFSGNLTDQFRQLISSPAGVLQLVLRKSLYFSIPLLTLLFIRLWSRRWHQWDTAALLLLCASIPAMQYAMLLNGSSFGWLRFFVYPFMIAAAWIPHELGALRQTRYFRPAATMLCLALASSSFVVRDMNNNELSPDEYELFHIEQSGTYKDLHRAREVAKYTDGVFRQAEEGKLPLMLTDSYSAYAVLLNTSFPRQWVITNDRDFEKILPDPYENGVEYILVSKKIGSVLQIIHETYPDLYEKGTFWTELEKDFNGEWKLFRVTGSTDPEGG